MAQWLSGDGKINDAQEEGGNCSKVDILEKMRGNRIWNIHILLCKLDVYIEYRPGSENKMELEKVETATLFFPTTNP